MFVQLFLFNKFNIEPVVEEAENEEYQCNRQLFIRCNDYLNIIAIFL